MGPDSFVDLIRDPYRCVSSGLLESTGRETKTRRLQFSYPGPGLSDPSGGTRGWVIDVLELVH